MWLLVQSTERALLGGTCYAKYTSWYVVWLARPSHLNVRGAEGKEGLAAVTISSHLCNIKLIIIVLVGMDHTLDERH